MTTKTPAPATINGVVTVGLVAAIGMTIVGVLLAAPESSNPATVLTIVIGLLGTIVPTILNTLMGGQANKKLDRVLNGEMDRKIEGAVHRVLDARGPQEVLPPAVPDSDRP